MTIQKPSDRYRAILSSKKVRFFMQGLRRYSWLFIGAAGLGSFLLAILIGSHQSVWFDEAYSIAVAQHPIHQLIQLTSVDNHPPLYYLLLKGWAGIFGYGAVALRSLSALCGGLAVIVGLGLVKRLWGARVALIASPFALLAPFIIRYSFEIRMYALASLIGMVATYVLVLATQAKQHRLPLWIGYGLLVAAGMYTLYYTVFIWVVHLIWLAWLYSQDRKHTATSFFKEPWIAAYALSVVLFVPWLPYFFKQLQGVQNAFWIQSPTYHTVVSIWSFFFTYMAEWQLGARWSLVFMLSFVTSIVFVTTAFRVATKSEKKGLMLLLLYTIVPIVLLYLLSLPPLQPVFIERYVSHTILATYLLLGVSIAIVVARYRKLYVSILAVMLVGVLVAGVVHLSAVGNYNFQQLYKPNTNQIADYLQSHLTTKDEPIIADSPYTYFELHYYMPHARLLFYSRANTSTAGGYAMLHGSPLRVSAAETFSGQPVWLIYRGSQPSYAPLGHVPAATAYVGRYRVSQYVSVRPATAIITKPLHR